MVTFDNRHIFWQAFLVASVIFWIGLLLGMSFENSRVTEVQDFYFDSQTDLFDFELASNVVFSSNLSCEEIHAQGVIFADKIFKEASKLEKYDDSNKLTGNLISLHKRYDLLRANLWQDIIEADLRCVDKVNLVVYFYDYVDTSLTDRAMQGAMSSVLIELKGEYGDGIILIPIATDTNLGSVEALMKIYDIESVPSILVNNEYLFSSIDSLKNIEDKLYKKPVREKVFLN